MTVFSAWQRSPITGQVLFDSQGYPLPLSQVGANTYGQMQSRISDEVLGPSTPDQVKNAIQDAIGTFEREAFWFNEMRWFTAVPGAPSSLNTNYGQEFYSYDDFPILIQLPHIRNIAIFAFNNRYPLANRTSQWMDEQSLSATWLGLPTDWCWEAGSLRLYPVPNGVYSLILTGVMRFAPLVNDDDSNPWTNEAEAMIRTEAKRLLFRNIARDNDQAQIMELELYGQPQLGRQGYLAQLRRETQRRAGGPGKLRPSRGYMS